jgi:hypothetical protein
MNLVGGLTSVGGIMAGEGAATADLGALTRAKAMETAGHDAPSIWGQTGWFKGPEGRWKFEIPDTDAKVNRTYEQGGFKMGAQTVGQAVQHPDLMAAYPDLAKTKVAWDAEPANAGAYYQGESGRPERIGLGPASDMQRREIMLHELQHAVQQREGFEQGSTPDPRVMMRDFPDLFPEMVTKGLGGRQSADYRPEVFERMVAESARRAATSVYRRSAGEAEARAVAERANMTPGQLAATIPTASYDVPLDQLIMRGIQVGR